MKAFSAVNTYFQGVASEMRKVVWPSFPVLLRYFFSVVVGIILAGLFIGGIDYLFIHLLAYVIK